MILLAYYYSAIYLMPLPIFDVCIVYIVIFSRYNNQTSRCHTAGIPFHVEHDEWRSAQRPRDIWACKQLCTVHIWTITCSEYESLFECKCRIQQQVFQC